MAKPSIPTEEMQRFELQRSIGKMTARYVGDTAAPADIHQFETDFAALAFAIIAPSQPRTAKVRERGALPQLKRVPGPRRLPFGPLRRMANRISPRVLRYIMKVGSDQSMEYFRLELRVRLDKEFPQGNLYKDLGEDLDAIRFGHAVLTIERDTGVTRGKAYGNRCPSHDNQGCFRTFARARLSAVQKAVQEAWLRPASTRVHRLPPLLLAQ